MQEPNSHTFGSQRSVTQSEQSQIGLFPNTWAYKCPQLASVTLIDRLENEYAPPTQKAQPVVISWPPAMVVALLGLDAIYMTAFLMCYQC